MKNAKKTILPFLFVIFIVFVVTLDSKPIISKSENEININKKHLSVTLGSTYVYVCEDNEFRQLPFYHTTKSCNMIKGCPKSSIKKLKLKKAIKSGYSECTECMIGD